MDPMNIRKTIRAKRLGILIRDARMVAGRTLKDCARALGFSPRTLRAYEQGKQAPSLPELAALAYYLRLPIEHFWRNEVRSDDPPPVEQWPLAEMLETYNLAIAERLRKAREERGWRLQTLSQKTHIPVSRLKRYEAGTHPISVPELDILAEALGIRISAFFEDAPGALGDWIRSQQRLQGFLNLPEDLQEFVSHPVNRPYLEIAQRLSQLPVDRLRAIAEGLLEITL